MKRIVKRATLNKYRYPSTELKCPFCGHDYKELDPVDQIRNKNAPFSQCPKCETLHMMEILIPEKGTIISLRQVKDTDEVSQEEGLDG